MICFLRSGSWIASLNASINSGSSATEHLHIVDVQHAAIFFPTFHNTRGGNGCSCLYYPDLLVENKGKIGGKICLCQFAVQGA